MTSLDTRIISLDEETDLFSERLDNEYIDFKGKPDTHRRRGHIHNGKRSYVMSSVNAREKFSTAYYNCTGVVGTGTDAITGQQLSFLTHQNPEAFLPKVLIQKFSDYLRDRLGMLLAKSVDDTVQFKIIGGNGCEHFNQYQESVELVHDMIKDETGEQAVIACGANLEAYMYQDAHISNDKILTIAREFCVLNTESEAEFTIEELHKKIKIWKQARAMAK